MRFSTSPTIIVGSPNPSKYSSPKRRNPRSFFRRLPRWTNATISSSDSSRDPVILSVPVVVMLFRHNAPMHLVILQIYVVFRCNRRDPGEERRNPSIHVGVIEVEMHKVNSSFSKPSDPYPDQGSLQAVRPSCHFRAISCFPPKECASRWHFPHVEMI